MVTVTVLRTNYQRNQRAGRGAKDCSPRGREHFPNHDATDEGRETIEIEVRPWPEQKQ